MAICDGAFWAIGLACDMAITKRETLQKHGVKTVAVFSNSQAIIQRITQRQLGPAQQLARHINSSVRNRLPLGIATKIHWVAGPSSILVIKEAESEVNKARDASGSTVVEWPFTSAPNRARLLSQG